MAKSFSWKILYQNMSKIMSLGVVAELKGSWRDLHLQWVVISSFDFTCRLSESCRKLSCENANSSVGWTFAEMVLMAAWPTLSLFLLVPGSHIAVTLLGHILKCFLFMPSVLVMMHWPTTWVKLWAKGEIKSCATDFILEVRTISLHSDFYTPLFLKISNFWHNSCFLHSFC